MNGPVADRGRARPAHPRFTAFPVAAYVFAAVFDAASLAGGPRHAWAGQLWHAGTFVLTAGSALGLVTIGTGFADLVRFASPARVRAAPGTGRLVAGHLAVMLVAFLAGAADLGWRLHDHADTRTPLAIAGLSAATAALVIGGGFLGGKLVYGHGISVSRPAAGADPDLPDPAGLDDHVEGMAELAGRPQEAWPGAGWPQEAWPGEAAPPESRPSGTR